MPRPPSALPTLLGIPYRPLAQLAPDLIAFVRFPLLPPRFFLLSHPLPQSLTSRSDQENRKTGKVMFLDEEGLSS